MGTSPRSGGEDRDEQGWEEEEHFPLSVAASPPRRVISPSVVPLALKIALLKNTGCGLGLDGFSCAQNLDQPQSTAPPPLALAPAEEVIWG